MKESGSPTIRHRLEKASVFIADALEQLALDDREPVSGNGGVGVSGSSVVERIKGAADFLAEALEELAQDDRRDVDVDKAPVGTKIVSGQGRSGVVAKDKERGRG